jgi:hypothetical protein
MERKRRRRKKKGKKSQWMESGMGNPGKWLKTKKLFSKRKGNHHKYIIIIRMTGMMFIDGIKKMISAIRYYSDDAALRLLNIYCT